MTAKTTRRNNLGLGTWTEVRIPETALDQRVLELAAPLLARLGTDVAPEAVRSAVELAIAFWNAKVKASTFWVDPTPKPFDDMQRRMTGKNATAADAEAFGLLAQQWRDRPFDPRLIGDWSLEFGDDGRPRLSCEMRLPNGVKAHVAPPIEKRVAIGRTFLDEVRIRQTDTSYLSFPVEAHSGRVGDDGSIVIRTKMPTALALFASAIITPVGGAPIDITVGGNAHGGMVLSEVRCDANRGRNDIAILVFKPGSP